MPRKSNVDGWNAEPTIRSGVECAVGPLNVRASRVNSQSTPDEGQYGTAAPSTSDAQPPSNPVAIGQERVSRPPTSWRDMEPYMPVRELEEYSSFSLRRLRPLLSDALHPLPHYRIGKNILVRRSEFDAWIAQFRHAASGEVIDSLAAVEPVERGLLAASGPEEG